MSPFSRAALACAALFGAACDSGNTAPASRPSDAFVATPVAQFAEPWAMTFLPDGGLLDTGRKSALKLLDVESGKIGDIGGVPRVAYGSQGGFCDVLLHADYGQYRIVNHGL